MLRNNDELKKYVQSKLKAVYSELLDCDEKYGVNYVDWVLEKLLQNKLHFKEVIINKEIKKLRGQTDEQSKETLHTLLGKRKKVLPKNYPESLAKGDIIYVKYGIALGDELSNGHYGIILNRKGSLFLIAPLTSTPQPYKELNVHLSDLKLPGESPTGSYISFNHTKYIHYRRIENIKGIPDGKKKVDPQIADKILLNFYNLNK